MRRMDGSREDEGGKVGRIQPAMATGIGRARKFSKGFLISMSYRTLIGGLGTPQHLAKPDLALVRFRVLRGVHGIHHTTANSFFSSTLFKLPNRIDSLPF